MPCFFENRVMLGDARAENSQEIFETIKIYLLTL